MQSMNENPQERRFAIVWISCLAVIVAVREFLPSLLRYDLHDEDFAHHIWWLYHWTDPQLFPDDLARMFFSQPILAPYGYQFPLPYSGAFHRSATACRGAPVCIGSGCDRTRVSDWAACWPGDCWAEWWPPRSSLWLNCASCTLVFPGPLPPRFCCVGIWALLTQRQIALGCALLLVVLFYPPVAANLGLCAAIVLALRVWKERKLPAHWPVLIGLGCLALVVLGLAYLRPVPPETRSESHL